MNCPNCGRDIPTDSQLCPYCGFRIAPAGVAERPSTGPTQRFDQGELARPAEPEPTYRAEPSYAPQPAQGGGGSSFGTRQAIPIGAVWLIGLGILFLTGTFWPGILILVGLSAAIGTWNQGRPNLSLSPLIFFVGLAILAWTNWWWPGMLILIGVMMLINAGTLRNLGR